MKNQIKNKDKHENGWESPNSIYRRIPEEGPVERIEGRFVFHSASFDFSLRKQKSGRYPLRGTVRALSNTGGVLKIRGEAKRKLFESLPENQRNDNNRKLNVCTNIHCAYTSDEAAKAVIVKAVSRLYSENKELISSQLSSGAGPDTITPIIAAQLKGPSFVSFAHNRVSDKEREKLIKRICNCCAKLPAKAMPEIKKTELRNWFETYNIGKEEQKELYKFWEFCCERGICSGTNPVDPPKKNRNTPLSNQAKAKRIVELEPAHLNKLYNLLSDSVTDANVGIALMLSGFEPSFITQLKWKDIVFHKEDDFVVIRYFKDDGESATKNYSRPLVPRSALILRQHYENVLGDGLADQIAGDFVLRNKQSKAKPYRYQNLIQEATRLINAAGISFSVINELTNEDRSFAAARKILLNTYSRCIYEYCRMNEDPGTANFLLGKSFGTDTTSSSYTSFTAPEAERRLYTILKVLSEDKSMKRRKEVIERDESVILTYGPDRTSEFVGVNGKIHLPKGCEIVIRCPHGVSGYIKAFNAEENALNP